MRQLAPAHTSMRHQDKVCTCVTKTFKRPLWPACCFWSFAVSASSGHNQRLQVDLGNTRSCQLSCVVMSVRNMNKSKELWQDSPAHFSLAQILQSCQGYQWQGWSKAAYVGCLILSCGLFWLAELVKPEVIVRLLTPCPLQQADYVLAQVLTQCQKSTCPVARRLLAYWLKSMLSLPCIAILFIYLQSQHCIPC